MSLATLTPGRLRIALSAATIAASLSACGESDSDQATTPPENGLTHDEDAVNPRSPHTDDAFRVGRTAFLDGPLAGYRELDPGYEPPTEPVTPTAEFVEATRAASVRSATWADEFPEFLEDEPADPTRTELAAYLDSHPDAVAAYGQLIIDYPDFTIQDTRQP